MTDRVPAMRREWWFTQLTLFLLAWMLVGPTLEDRWLTHLLMQLFLLNVVLMTLKANPGWGHARGVMIGFWCLALAGSLVAFAPTPDGWERLARGAETASLLPLLALLAAGILRFVYRSRRLTIDGILATAVVYVLIAIMFSRLYLLLLAANPQSFDLPVAAAERTPHLLQVDMLYYSLITQCSVGYGDILPATDVARMLAVIQAVVGQFYMAVVVAVFVGMYATQQRE
ncbi:MAG: potassium channel family protein [Betaproteobacteria bacterium]